jgi:predicted PurR-regulated permease PerM
MWIYKALTFYPLLWNVIFILILLIFFNLNKTKVYRLYSKAMKEEQDNLIREQLNDIDKVKRRIEIQRVLEVS